MARPQSFTLLAYASNRYSKDGEDGVIAEILNRLKIADGWCCEVGAWDGIYRSNTRALVEAGWRGVFVESDIARYAKLVENVAGFGDRAHTIHAAVTADGPSRLDNLLPAIGIPERFELLSVDTDGADHGIWQGLWRYRPLIVIVEASVNCPLGTEHIGQPLRSCRVQDLTSFTSMLRLGREKQYTLACHTGNMIFVADERAGDLSLPAIEIDDPYSMFDTKYSARFPDEIDP